MKNSASIFEFDIPENPIVHENFDSIIEFADSLDCTIHPQNFSIFYTERKFVQCWLILPNFGYHGKPLCSLKNSLNTFEFYNPENRI